MLRHMAVDPIQLTKQLVNIESTTYCEGPAGVFLDGAILTLVTTTVSVYLLRNSLLNFVR